ncbi:hypothetical protein, partial [Francisella tularensis]|uniref:hypothetical protein n=1 Tax=Francisella tularensis TaxID=263 RepID=UPI001C0EA7AA
VGYEWNVNGTKVETKTNVLTQTAPAFNAIADNKIRVTVVAIDDGGVKSEESAEIGIDQTATAFNDIAYNKIRVTEVGIEDG